VIGVGVATEKKRGRLGRALDKIGATVRERDWLGVLLLLEKAVPDSLCAFRCVVVTRGPAEFKIPALRRRKNTVCRQLAPADVRALEFLPEMEEGTPDELKKRFAEDLTQGLEGFVTEVNGKTVAYTFAAYDLCEIPEVCFERELSLGEAQSLKSYVHPTHRFSGVYLELMREISRRLVERDVRWCFGHTDHLNQHSLRTHKRLGYREVGRIAMIDVPFLRLRARRLEFESNRFHWSLSRKRPRADESVDPSQQRSTKGGVLTIW
jgi:ribosomal protein S18 acetylase RimI-like enzyme